MQNIETRIPTKWNFLTMRRKTNFQPKVKQLRIWLNKYSRDTFPDVEEKSLALACI